MLNFTNINLLAVLAASVFSFILGGLWYTVLFGKLWQKEVKLTEEQLNNTNYLKTYGGSFVCIFLMMLFLAVLLKRLGIFGSNQWFEAAKVGLSVGLFFVCTSTAINYLYEFKSLKLFLINTGYQAVFLTLGAVILAFFG